VPFDLDGIVQYDKEELKTILENQSARVIDVRTSEEYEAGHIPNVPLRPMQDVMDWVDELNPDESYVFVCRSGSRSQRVAAFLKENGFANVSNFSGGMLGWDGDVES
jgi:rhodanese-related sulfurtransferase